MKICHACKAELNIRIMPDFTASGMWCSNCGICFANPRKTFPFIPKGLIDLIQGWNDFWDLISSYPGTLGYSSFQKLLDNMGIELEKQLSVYCKCWFDKECSKIYPLIRHK
jgi:hypothetical protein